MSRKPKIDDFRHFAILQTAFLGDTALTLYLAEQVRQLHPKSKITFVCTNEAASIVKCAEAVRNVIPFDKRGKHKGIGGIKLLAAMLRDIRVECILAPHRSLRTKLLTHYTKAKYSVGYKSGISSLMYRKRLSYPAHIHEADRSRALLNAFDGLRGIEKIAAPRPVMVFKTADMEYVSDLIAESAFAVKKPLVALAPGSVWPTKRWPGEHYRVLAEDLIADGVRIVLIGGAQDKELCGRIADKSGALDLSGKLSLPQSMILLKACRAIVSNDSAPTHLAGLIGCPAITIFGPTTPLLGFAPLGEKSKVMELNEMKCRPCSIHGGYNCPLGTHECMQKIKPDQVYLACMEVIHTA